ncbi:hypothetical protein TNCV_1409771 [Trichonephila clavipes]|uniref:Uncharacterized protein n=1 Tax=Trichonephila clavipes TaxID=2585209 RepID=A0A8X6R281_TRICX|nr:hypothetical protein TNCV_1409771 [Trichonephila clavipes]
MYSSALSIEIISDVEFSRRLVESRSDKLKQVKSRKTTQLGSRNETTQLVSRHETTQLISRNETTQLNRRKQLNSSVGTKQLNSALPSTACNRLQPPTTAYNRLQPPAPPAPPLQQNRLFYLLTSRKTRERSRPWMEKKKPCPGYRKHERRALVGTNLMRVLRRLEWKGRKDDERRWR